MAGRVVQHAEDIKYFVRQPRGHMIQIQTGPRRHQQHREAVLYCRPPPPPPNPAPPPHPPPSKFKKPKCEKKKIKNKMNNKIDGIISFRFKMEDIGVWDLRN